MNAVFGLRSRLSIGEELIVAVLVSFFLQGYKDSGSDLILSKPFISSKVSGFYSLF